MLDPYTSLEDFRSAIMAYTGTSHCHLVSSGRCALTIALLALQRMSGRTKVILPAYGCPTLVQAVLEAGLKPVFCDVDPRTLDFDRTQLHQRIDHELLAVIPTHLYGVPIDITDLLGLAQEHGIFVIEDAAQAFGARMDKVSAGAVGHVGIYSLGRGKCLPTGHGGVIVCQDRYASAISDTLYELVPDTIRRGSSSLAGFLGYGLATRPFAWWFVARSPLNPAKQGMNIKSLPRIKFQNLPTVQAGIGISILNRIEEINKTRRRNAKRLMKSLSGFSFVSFPMIAPNADPNFLRLPFLVKEIRTGERLFSHLWREGIGISRSYSRTLPDLYSDQLLTHEKAFPGADRLAACLYTLPTHMYLKEADFSCIVEAFDTINRTMD